jgi:uncharacterized protein YfaS (alpha-2-macroglobulin family)
VPDVAFRNAMDNLRNQINYSADFDSNGGPVAYALMVLAREGAAAMGDLRYYADVKADAFDTPIAAAQLGAALASYGDQTRADAMFKRAADMVAQVNLTQSEAQVWRADYGTNLRDATAVLALGTEAGSTAFNADRLGQSVAAEPSQPPAFHAGSDMGASCHSRQPRQQGCRKLHASTATRSPAPSSA